ncbi:MAG: PD-(D/E)XK nuclease family protein [Clostridiales bacterium]|nr:PD-(D/E)XK nuclease family protein [Clostridiales bacterium]
MVEIYTDSSALCRTEDIIRKVIGQSWERRKFFIAPESSKASVERVIISELIKGEQTSGSSSVSLPGGKELTVEGALVNGDVLSFMRLAGRILEMCGAQTGAGSDKMTMRNAVYRVMSDRLQEFRTFGKLIGKYEYIDKLIDLLGDFSRYGIDEDKIAAAFETAESKERNMYSDKIHDFKLLAGYLSEMNELYGLTLMTDNIAMANRILLKTERDRSLLDTRRYRPLKKMIDSRFIVLGFGKTRVLTPEETEFVSHLSSLGAEILFFPVYPGSSDDTRIFYSAGKAFTENICKQIPDTVIRDISELIDIPDIKGDPAVIEAASKYAFGEDLSSTDLRSDNIVTASFESVEDRIAYVCNEIIRLTTGDTGVPDEEKLYRYRDIRIVCVDDDIYTRLDPVMSVFGLDTFIDRQMLMVNTPVFRYAVRLLLLEVSGFSLPDVMRFLRTGLLPVLPEVCDLFENYCVKRNIVHEGRMFDHDSFVPEKKYPMRVLADGKTYPAATYLWEEVMEKILIPCRAVVKLISEEKNLSGKARILAEHISGMLDIIKPLTDEMSVRSSEKASAVANGYKELMKLLASFTDPMNDVPVTMKNFVSLLEIDMRNKVQGTIPLNIDSVEITSPSNSHMTPCKVLFILGAKNDNFPYKGTVDGLLSADELKMFSEDTGVDLPDKAESRSREEFISSALMLSCVTDKVYFVGEYKAKPSSVQLFYENFSLRKDINNFKNPVFGKIPERRHDYSMSSIDPDIMRRIIKDGFHMSVSSLEKYDKCRLQYMLDSILMIKPRDDGRDIRPSTVGSMLHDMLETSLKKICAGKTPQELAEYAEHLRANEDELTVLSEAAFRSYLDRSDDPPGTHEELYRNPGRKTRRIFMYVLPYLLSEAGAKNYVPTGFEQRLEKLPDPPRIATKQGITFDFVGSIDRVDTDPSTGNVRVIDYKSGAKSIDLSKTLAGLQTQLFIYSGFLGKNIEGADVVDAGYVEIGLKPDPKGVVPSPKLAGLEPEEMEIVEQYVESLIDQGCEEIASGRADAKVNSKSGKDGAKICELCPFAGMCGNDPKCPSYEYKGSYDKCSLRGKGRTDHYLDIMRERLGIADETEEGTDAAGSVTVSQDNGNSRYRV